MSQGFLCDHKTGRKLLLGKKFTQIALKMIQEGRQKTINIKIWQFKLDVQGLPKWNFASILHSLPIITLNYVITSCYEESICQNVTILSI